MKKLFIPCLFGLLITACNAKEEKTTVEKPVQTTPAEQPVQPTSTDTLKKEVMKPVAEQLYACPMHPEVKGKKDAKCPKCGMKLTVPVKS